MHDVSGRLFVTVEEGQFKSDLDWMGDMDPCVVVLLPSYR